MPTVEISSNKLLDAVRQMPPEEFTAFIEQALALRPQPKTTILSAEETKLIERINRGLSLEWRKRYSQLIRKRKKVRLTSQQHQELLELTHQMECRDADRAAALLELAHLRAVPIRVLMKQMGIEAPPVHG
jgi:hypothetical protein